MDLMTMLTVGGLRCLYEKGFVANTTNGSGNQSVRARLISDGTLPAMTLPYYTRGGQTTVVFCPHVDLLSQGVESLPDPFEWMDEDLVRAYEQEHHGYRLTLTEFVNQVDRNIWLPTTHAADLMGVTPKQIHRWLKAGHINGPKILKMQWLHCDELHVPT